MTPSPAARDLRDDLVLPRRRQRAELGDMSHRHLALPAVAHRLLGDVPHVEVLGLVGEVHVEVGNDAELRREPEHDVDLGARVAVVVRAAADEVGALAQRAREQGLRAGHLQDALLGEGAELQIDRRAVLVPKRHERLERLELDDGIDLDVAAHRRRAVAHRHVQHRAAPARECPRR